MTLIVESLDKDPYKSSPEYLLVKKETDVVHMGKRYLEQNSYEKRVSLIQRLFLITFALLASATLVPLFLIHERLLLWVNKALTGIDRKIVLVAAKALPTIQKDPAKAEPVTLPIQPTPATEAIAPSLQPQPLVEIVPSKDTQQLKPPQEAPSTETTPAPAQVKIETPPVAPPAQPVSSSDIPPSRPLQDAPQAPLIDTTVAPVQIPTVGATIAPPAQPVQLSINTTSTPTQPQTDTIPAEKVTEPTRSSNAQPPKPLPIFPQPPTTSEQAAAPKVNEKPIPPRLPSAIPPPPPRPAGLIPPPPPRRTVRIHSSKPLSFLPPPPPPPRRSPPKKQPL